MILALLPIFVAIDFGGVLWWTQYVAGLAIVAAFVLALPSLVDWHRHARPRQLLVIIPLLLWLAYSFFQTITLPPSLVAVLSPGSHAAYTEWLEPILPATKLPGSFPISISQDDTVHAVALFGILFILAWTSLRVFNTRNRLIGLLSCVAITGATVAILGVVGLMLPEIPFFDGMDSHFSTFVNRNNAALTMNLGMAASLGLLSWRLSALTGQELDGEEFEFNDLLALTSDRNSAVGVICALLCIIGLLVCGSRAGLATVLFASLLSLGWVRKRRGFSTIPVVLITTAILAALLTVPLQLDLESIQRMKFFSDSAETILNDGRFEHWPEGWQAAMAHLPGGSGLGTYNYAYLPHQIETPKAWFVHADNLWLELLVEQGFVGIGFTCLLFGVLIWCLHRMSYSHDAFDHGLRVAGWYSVGAILFSQCFDFGLIIPANLVLCIPILAAVVTRSVESDLIAPDASTKTENMWSRFTASQSFSLSMLGLQCVGVLGTLIAAATCTGVLHNDAVVDTFKRTAEYQLQSSGPGSSSIEDLGKEIQSFNDSQPHSVLIYSLSQIEHRRGRLAEVVSANPEDVAQARAIYEATSPKVRRLAGKSPEGFVAKFPAELSKLKLTQLPDEYQTAIRLNQSMLARTPLSREARAGLLYLDFASDDLASDPAIDQAIDTPALLKQLGELYRSNPRQLLAIANLAAQSQSNELAIKFWKSAIDQMPQLTVSAMNTIKNYKSVSLIDTLPEDRVVMRKAAKRVIQTRDKGNADSVPGMVALFDCDQCENSADEAACLVLAADAMVFASKDEDALPYYEQALELRPSNVSMRMKYIAALRRLGQGSDALKQARLGRQIVPGEKRFDTVIKQMAQLEIDQLNQGSNP
ncbi:O-Antigen ligase [Rubripirellula obstinata]|uniref:O-Antigen ligase n=1 Tax=Rubripirellula obstinata TaxID=406547 RepID=A0A5B1CJU4_9BACT|nr:O-Antigen ligase [Rubripirellula obstinata]